MVSVIDLHAKRARYALRGELGRGGLGVVQLVFDHVRGEEVARKRVHIRDHEAEIGLKREFRIASELQHPGLVRLLDLGVDGEGVFFTMEVVPGVDLYDAYRGQWSRPEVHLAPMGLTVTDGATRDERPRTASQSRIGTRTAEPYVDGAALSRLLPQLVNALAFLHANGVVHRDLKPSNVLVTREGVLKVVDFGIAAPLGDASFDGRRIAGTPAFMAPEQVGGEALGPPADLYALGCVIFTLIAGRPVFVGTSDSVLHQHRNAAPPSLRAFAEDVPPELDALCAALLRKDPAARPKAAEVLRELENVLPAPSRALRANVAVHDGDLLEREELLARLGAAIMPTPRDPFRAVVLTGASGMGKTAVLDAITTRLEVRPLRADARPRENIPFNALDRAIDALATAFDDHDVGRLLEEPEVARDMELACAAFPALRRRLPTKVLDAPAETSRLDLFRALFRVVARVSALGPPVLLCIDDLQWADDDSIAVLDTLVRTAPSGIAVLATLRDDVAPSAGSRWAERTARMVRLELPPLSEGSIRALVERGAAHAPFRPGDVSALVKRCAGRPFMALAMARAYAEAGPEVLGAKDVVVAQIDSLEMPRKRLLALLAAASGWLPLAELAGAADESVGGVDTALRPLERLGLVRRGGLAGATQEARLYHDTVDVAVLATLDAALVRDAHARLARYLESTSAPPLDRIAEHYFESGERARAGEYALAAATQAARTFAFEHSARLYARAIDLLDRSADEARGLRILRAEALANGGYGAAAATAYLEAARGASSATELDLRRLAAEQYLVAGRVDEGAHILRHVLASVDLALPRSPLSLLTGLVLLRLWLAVRWKASLEGRVVAARAPHPQALRRFDVCFGVSRAFTFLETVRGGYFHSRSLLLALKLGEPRRLAYALAFETAYSAAQGLGRYGSAMRVSAVARALASESGDAAAKAMAMGTGAFAAFITGRFEAARREADSAVAFVREHCPDAFWELRTYQMTGIWALAWMGRLRELSERVDAAARDAEHRSDLAMVTMLRTGQPSLSLLARGASSSARVQIESASRLWTPQGYQNQHYWALIALTQVDLFEGRVDDAFARVVGGWGRLRRGLILQVPFLHVEARYTRARVTLAKASHCLDLRVRARLTRRAEQDAAALRRSNAPYAEALGELLDAAVERLRGKESAAATLLRDAAFRLDAVGMDLHAACARHHASRILGGDEGRALRTASKAWFDAQDVTDVESFARMAVAGFS